MVADGIGNIIPLILFRFIAKQALDRIVIYIYEIGLGFFLSQLGDTSERGLKQRTLPVTSPVILPGKTGSVVMDKVRQFLPMVHYNGSVDMVGHLA